MSPIEIFKDVSFLGGSAEAYSVVNLDGCVTITNGDGYTQQAVLSAKGESAVLATPSGEEIVVYRT